MEKRLARLAIVMYMCLLPALGFAGETNYNWLDLTPTSSDTYSLEVNDTAGSAVLTIDTAGDVLFAETGGSTSNCDFEVDGYASFDGTTEFDGAIDIDGAINIDAASAITFQAGAYFTVMRVGTGSTPDVSATTEADGMFVEGDAEFDDTVRIDGVLTCASEDVDFDETGGSTGDPDFSVDGYAKFNGTVELASTVTYAATKRLWFPAQIFGLPASAPAALDEESGIETLKFADSSADDHAWLQIVWPNDCDESAAASMYIVYALDSDCTETEGEWNGLASVLGDGTTLAAAATQITTVHDLPQDAIKLNVTTAMTIPAAQIADDSVTIVDLYHDVSDPFGDAAQLVGVYIEYTSDTP